MELILQKLTKDDLVDLKELQPKGWENILPRIEQYIQTPFCHPLKTLIGNKIVGIGASIIHQDVAWLAHIIVHPDFHKQGIGTFITENLITSLREKKIETIYLIATDLGEPLYKKLGFKTDAEYVFYKDLKAKSNWKPSKHIHPLDDHYYSQVTLLDLQISGENRE
ncbi:MAG: GNAT family N-acetyltransferase, partial [Bacteroidetes bacterium]|nr:GNAT family N-acetyltransferase [Bacteroidota bacterium]